MQREQKLMDVHNIEQGGIAPMMRGAFNDQDRLPEGFRGVRRSFQALSGQFNTYRTQRPHTGPESIPMDRQAGLIADENS